MAKVTERNSILRAKIEAANAKVQRDAEAAEEDYEADEILSQKESNALAKKVIASKSAEDEEILTVEETGQKLAKAIESAIVTQQSTLFISATGVGKTDRFLEEIAQIRREVKVLVVMQSHALIQQSFEKFKKIQARLTQQGQIPNSWFGRGEVSTFVGKEGAFDDESPMCEKLALIKRTQAHPLPLTLFTKEQIALIKTAPPIKPKKITREDCESCYIGWCRYTEQFNTFHENIRFMTVHELYSEPSFYNRWQGKHWVPDLIIVDDHTLSHESFEVPESGFTEGMKQYCKELEANGVAKALEYYQFWLISDAKKAAGEIKAVHGDGSDEAEAVRLKQTQILEVCGALANAEKSCVRTEDGFKYTKVYRMHPRFKHSTVIWFDGTANPEVFEKVYPGAKVVKFKTQKKELVRHIQVKTRSFSKYTLTNPENVNILIDWIAAECISKGIQKPGIISYMNISGVDAFACYVANQVELKIQGHPIVAHFGNTRGSNEFEDCDAIFVVGRYMMPPDVIQDLGRAVYGATCDLERVKGYQAVRFQDAEGLRYEPMFATSYKDPIAESIYQHFCVSETLQAIGRGRAYHSTKARDVYIITNQYLGEDFEVNEFRELYLPADINRLQNLTVEKSEETKAKIAETMQERGKNAFAVYVEMLSGLTQIEDTKAAFESSGVAVSVAKDKGRRHELAVAAGFTLKPVTVEGSRGRTYIKTVWTK